MSISLAQLIVWLFVGGLAGALAGMVVTGKREGLGRWPGLAVGLVGALIGGALFRLFNLWPGLESVSISLRDIVAACIGSLIFLVILWIIKTRGTA
jgi:uncharacterized membrane protein YeaQ/YmgE (transglycosylase-associated protein family)